MSTMHFNFLLTKGRNLHSQPQRILIRNYLLVISHTIGIIFKIKSQWSSGVTFFSAPPRKMFLAPPSLRKHANLPPPPSHTHPRSENSSVLLTTLLLPGNWCKKYKQTFTKTTIKCLQIAINLTKRHAIALRISYQVIVSIQRDSEFIAPVILR